MSDFFEACARARQAAAYIPSDETVDAVGSLDRLAGNAYERTLVATVEIIGGTMKENRALYQSGIQKLRAATTDELLQAVEWIPDLTILGPPRERRALLERAVVARCDPSDAALNFLRDPGLGDARTLITGKWSPSPHLPAPLLPEFRRWLIWAGLDAWLEWRRHEYLAVSRHQALRPRAEEDGGWESGVVDAIVDLANSSVDDACVKVGRLSRSRKLPLWAPERVARIGTSYSPLAGTRVADWLSALPSPPLAPERAVDPAERAGAAFRIVYEKNKHADLMRIHSDLGSADWQTFCYFCTVRRGHVGGELARLLLATVKRPEDVKRWPWVGRVDAFATACRDLEDRQLALELLVTALQALPGDQSLTGACIATLEACQPDELAVVVGTDLWDHLDGGAGLSEPKRMMLKRGGVWRVVIDGTNLAYGGRAGAAGAQATLALVKEAWSQLRSAGFEKIVTWFDASTRYHLAPGEDKELDRLHASGEVCVVSSGPADSKVIETFLEAPEHTWVVTCDRFRDWLPQYPALAQNWPRSQLAFHIDHNGALGWARPLDGPSRRA